VQNASTVTSKEEALDFIKKHGFVTLFPIRGKNFPNLYQAIVGTREEKFKKAFQWADELSVNQKKILYGKLVKGQTTLISIDILPLFYKAYQRSDFSGLPSRILAFIKQNDPTSTSELKEKLNMTGPRRKSEFIRAIDLLHNTFSIAVVSKGKPPRHTHTYDLIERWMPKELLVKAESLSAEEAKQRIVARTIENCVASSHEEAEALLGLKM